MTTVQWITVVTSIAGSTSVTALVNWLIDRSCPKRQLDELSAMREELEFLKGLSERAETGAEKALYAVAGARVRKRLANQIVPQGGLVDALILMSGLVVAAAGVLLLTSSLFGAPEPPAEFDDTAGRGARSGVALVIAGGASVVIALMSISGADFLRGVVIDVITPEGGEVRKLGKRYAKLKAELKDGSSSSATLIRRPARFFVPLDSMLIVEGLFRDRYQPRSRQW